jgi:Ca2+-binding EF-hand superfamily protein
MAFRVLDTDHDGVVDSEELSHGLGKLLALLGRKEKLDDIVAQLLPHKDDCLSDEEWVRSEIATRLINRETVKPLLL